MSKQPIKDSNIRINPNRVTFFSKDNNSLKDWEINYKRVGGLNFSIPNVSCELRADLWRKKEPNTNKWIEGFNSESVFLDIGAHIGVYSLYAASLGHKVLAFEPEALNYSELCKNIYLNDLSDKIQAYPAAISDMNGLSHLNVLNFMPGRSHHNFNSFVNKKAFKQGAIGFKLDDLKLYPQPDYIKIDVDGFEDKVVKSGRKTLTQCKSILIETNNNDIIKSIEEMGFKINDELTGKIDRENLPEDRNIILDHV